MTENLKTMKEVVEKAGNMIMPLKTGSTYEVTILSKTKNRILVNLNDLNLGIIPEKEFSTEIYDLKVGDKVVAYLIEIENDEGYAVLSLKRADKEKIKQNLKQKMESGETIKVKVKDANRGGLVVVYGNLEGFLPISQLSQKYTFQKENPNYIVNELKKLINKILDVKIINIDSANNKLIFSEKEVTRANQSEKIKKLYNIGDKVKGRITAIVPFGLFVDLGETEGLVHISEISWERVGDLNKMFKVGDEITAQIIDLENGKVSLSLKKLIPDPWIKNAQKYKEGDEVEGRVTKITPFGAFVELDDKTTALVHISELNGKDKDQNSLPVEDTFIIDKKYKFLIKKIDLDNRRMALTLSKDGLEINKKKKVIKKKSK